MPYLPVKLTYQFSYFVTSIGVYPCSAHKQVLVASVTNSAVMFILMPFIFIFRNSDSKGALK